MKYRLSFDDKIFADFIAFIRKKSNGGSESASLKKWIIERYAIECNQKMTQIGQKMVTNTSNEGQVANSNEINLSGLDSIFLEKGE